MTLAIAGPIRVASGTVAVGRDARIRARLLRALLLHASGRGLGNRRFGASLAALRELGASIALDDVGLGHSNFMMIIECRPNYFKIDRYFVHGARTDVYRQAVLSSVAQLALPFGARVVAEGVETEADLEAVRQAGINLAQGYLFGQPATQASLALVRTRGAA